MRGSTAKYLRKVTAEFNKAGHPVSYKKLKKGWLNHGRDVRQMWLDTFMRQGQIFLRRNA